LLCPLLLSAKRSLVVIAEPATVPKRLQTAKTSLLRPEKLRSLASLRLGLPDGFVGVSGIGRGHNVGMWDHSHWLPQPSPSPGLTPHTLGTGPDPANVSHLFEYSCTRGIRMSAWFAILGRILERHPSQLPQTFA